jgi:glucose-1-phosphate thymidylyltransferase
MVTKAVLFAPADRHETMEPSPHALRAPNPQLAMLPVGNRPLVLHALDELSDAGIDQIAVVSEEEVSAEVQSVIDHWPLARHAKLHVSVESDRGFLDALHEVGPWIGADSFVLHLCDSLRHDGLATALADPPAGPNDVLTLVESPDGDGAVPVRPGLSSLRSAGIHVFGAGVLQLAGDEPARRWDTQIASAAESLAAAGGRLEVRSVHAWWRYRQRPDVLLQANRYFLSGLGIQATEARLENTDLQGPVLIDPTARLRSATVRGPAIIGPDADISDAYIGPYTSIGRGVVIENAEVEHSIVLPGASIKHLGGRLEASVIGADARVFRDFRLPRAFRLNVGERAEVAVT